MDSVLIANRGEIAVRIIRSAKELGMRAIAIYSEIDRDALHVELADEAWNVGPAPAADSYLNGRRIVEAALESGAEAVHPGYGFLSENPGFATLVAQAGLVWVGPPPEAIAAMGDKIASRRSAAEAGVEGVPGTLEPVRELAEVEAFIAEAGYPVAIKAAHGGGGKGLRVVRDDAELAAGYEAASREADAYFASPEVYLERYLDRPRHVEAQIIFDHHGNGVFMGERDCSSQRRHQKLIEESPSVRLDPDVRAAIGEAALAVGRSCAYRNAGTVEFLLDRAGRFYFLEMNTRLQVEHTITEMVTGIDIVKEQFRVAAGEQLSFDRLDPVGHAVQLRINAEDPAAGFLPSPGRIAEYREPGGFGVRVDSGVRTGSRVSQYYDNLIAKLVVWGRDRPEAIQRAQRALAEYVIRGVATTIPAHELVLAHPTFVAGEHHTRFIEDEVDFAAAAPTTAPALPEEEETSERQVTVEVGGRRYDVRMWLPDVSAAVSGTPVRRRPPRLARQAAPAGDGGVITAPMQGTIVKVLVKGGDRVRSGQAICILEAMKMENEVRSQTAGEVVDLRVQAGDSVAAGAVVAIVR